MTQRLASRLTLSLAVAAFAGNVAMAQQSSECCPGFLTGLQGFEKFHEPLGQPIYFESPFNESSLRALYLRHNFSDQSTLAGGDVTIYALQARMAITDRWQFIATKDGYSDLNSGIIKDEGWNDIAAGFKYVAYADQPSNTVVSAGLRYMAENGHRGILQGGVSEWSPFVSLGKGFGDGHLLANVTLRVPSNQDDGNTVGHWDLHFDYDVNPGDATVFAPLVEVHGVHYLSDGASTLNVGGLDYANLGTSPAENFVAWAGIGARVEHGRFEAGACYEFALTDPDKDIMESRITVDFIVRW